MILHKLQLFQNYGNNCFYLILLFLKTWEEIFVKSLFTLFFLSTALSDIFVIFVKVLVIHYSETAKIAHIKTFLITLKLEGDVDCWDNETFTDNFKISVNFLTNQIATCSMKSWLLRTWESHRRVFIKTTTSSLQSYCLLINKIILTSPNESKPSHFSVYFHVWKTPLSNKFEKSLLQWHQNRMWRD